MKPAKIAAELFSAHREAREVTRFTAAYPGFSLREAYEAQSLLLGLHRKAGDLLVGRKMGLTSRPKMQQMGVHEPIHGFLTNAMQVPDGGTLSLKNRIHAKIEPEIAFVLGRTLRGSPSVTEALRCVDGVCGALEIIDSRYRNFEFQLPDVVADNGSSSGFVLGGALRRPGALDLANLGILVEVNGRAQLFGSSAAILGNPGRSLAALAALLDDAGESLDPGSVVLAGAATAAIPLAAGQWVRASFQGLGGVEIRVEE
ncbi:MAG: 2-keto-4-pentenoate hydratase [Bdellovibrionota bacterium]